MHLFELLLQRFYTLAISMCVYFVSSLRRPVEIHTFLLIVSALKTQTILASILGVILDPFFYDILIRLLSAPYLSLLIIKQLAIIPRVTWIVTLSELLPVIW